MLKKKIKGFKKGGVAKFETKFGGQPDWLSEPQWPLNTDYEENRQMMFVCQINLNDEIFECDTLKMAYIFTTHQATVDGDEDFDPDIIDPESGCTAVIIQPDGILFVKTDNIKEGPTLFDEDDEPYVGGIDFEIAEEVDFIASDDFCELADDEQDTYTNKIEGDKIGGAPYFIEDDAFPDDEHNWKLLLQLDSNFQPFFLNLGASPCMFAFISDDLKCGKIVIQGS